MVNSRDDQEGTEMFVVLPHVLCLRIETDFHIQIALSSPLYISFICKNLKL